MTRKQRSIEKAIDAVKTLLNKMEDLEPSSFDHISVVEFHQMMRIHEGRMQALHGLRKELERELGDVE